MSPAQKEQATILLMTNDYVMCERFRCKQHKKVCAHQYHMGAFYRKCKKERPDNGRILKQFNGAGSCNILCAECQIGKEAAKVYPKMQVNKQYQPKIQPLQETTPVMRPDSAYVKELARIFFKREAV